MWIQSNNSSTVLSRSAEENFILPSCIQTPPPYGGLDKVTWRRPPWPLLKTLPRSGAMNTMIPRPHLLKSCKRPNRGDGRSLWRTLSPLPPGTVRFWSLLMHWQVDPPPLVNHTTDLVIFSRRWSPLLPCCGWPHVLHIPQPWWRYLQHHHWQWDECWCSDIMFNLCPVSSFPQSIRFQNV